METIGGHSHLGRGISKLLLTLTHASNIHCLSLFARYVLPLVVIDRLTCLQTYSLLSHMIELDCRYTIKKLNIIKSDYINAL